MSDDDERYLRMGEAIEALGGRFSRKVILKWCERGWVDGAMQTGPGGHWSIPQSELEKCAEQFAPKIRRRRRAI